jgi:hypothetical protein
MFDRIGSKRRQALVGVALFVGSIWLVMTWLNVFTFVCLLIFGLGGLIMALNATR